MTEQLSLGFLSGGVVAKAPDPDPQIPGADGWRMEGSQGLPVPEPEPPPPWEMTTARRHVLEDLSLLGPCSAVELVQKTGRGEEALTIAAVLTGILPYGFVERHKKGWACTSAGLHEVINWRPPAEEAPEALTDLSPPAEAAPEASVEAEASPKTAPASAPIPKASPISHRRAARGAYTPDEELPPPDVILAELLGNLNEGAAMIAGMEDMLQRDGGKAPTFPWVVLVLAAPPGPLVGRPVLVQAETRHHAEREVALAFRMRVSRCIALPAGILDVEAFPLEGHPDRPPHAPLDLADGLEMALRHTAEDIRERTRETELVNAELLGRAARRKVEAPPKEPAEEQGPQVLTRREPAPKAPRGKRAQGGGAPLDAGMRELTQRQRELLGLLAVDERSNRVHYTKAEAIPDWAALKQVVEALGGVWRGKSRKTPGGWVFPDDVDAPALIETAVTTGAVLDPKMLGFYATSDELAATLVARLRLRPGMVVLEPSAGRGALALAVRKACPEARVLCVELLPENRAELTAQGFELVGEDFLQLKPGDIPRVDAIACNPPFGAGRVELVHGQHMLSFLGAGGQFAGIFPSSLQFREDSATTAFREALVVRGAMIEKNPDKSFKDVGTMVKTVSVWFTGEAA